MLAIQMATKLLGHKYKLCGPNYLISGMLKCSF